MIRHTLISPQWLLSLLLCLWQCGEGSSLMAQANFDSAKNLVGQARIDTIWRIFNTTVNHADSTTAFVQLDALASSAPSDKALQVLTMHLRSAYYGGGSQPYKPLSLHWLEKAATILATTPDNDAVLTRLRAENQHAIGIHLYLYEPSKKNALAYLLRADALYRKVGYAKTNTAMARLSSIGEYYIRLNEPTTALKYLHEAEQYVAAEKVDWLRINLYNNIAICFTMVKRQTEAITYYNKIPKEVHLKQDSVWVGIAAGNIGAALVNAAKVLAAEPYLIKNLTYALRYAPTDSCNIGYTYAYLVYVAGKKHDKVAVAAYYKKALIYSVACNKYSGLLPVYENRMRADTAMGDYRAAFEHQTLMRTAVDSIASYEKVQEARQITIKFDAERSKLNARLATEAAEHTRIWLYIWVLIAALMTGAAYSIRSSLKTKAREADIRQRETTAQLAVATANNDRANNALFLATAELKLFTDNILAKNKLIQQLQKDVKASLPVAEPDENETPTTPNLLDSIAKNGILTEPDWQRFTKLFEQVHPDFIVLLDTRYAMLSKADIRLLVLTKLLLNSKQMSGVLGISVESLRKARYRVRQKISALPYDDEINVLMRRDEV